ncbi:MAG: SusC/RagA family TonB-linked outer membrane protein [Tannerellaceae bacterium]|nr:SusC/RagA family TonB-linked outer membrane protein [Tannerellaceae bacterium]
MFKDLRPISLLLLAGTLCFSGSMLAQPAPVNPNTHAIQQDGKVTGTITDDFGPVIGASVIIKGTTNGTVTDLDGNFSLSEVKNGDVIQISYVGYITQELTYTGQPRLSLKLSEDTQALDEIVVTALGIKRSEKSLGYAMKELKGDELNSNLINPVAALQGKVAGLEISNSDGGLFGSTKIQIRGASTLQKNNQPIYVVDGVILDNGIKEGDPDYSSHANDYGNELKNLNPQDFETVSVLKGAAATALYGSRGLNGAVVITTKSGKSGQGVGIQFSQTLGIDKVTSSPKLQNVFGNGTIAGFVDYGEIDANGNFYSFDNERQFYLNSAGNPTLIGAESMNWGPAFDGRQIEYYDGTYRAYSPQKNNFKDAYQTGFNTTTNVAVSGGNEKTTFYTSLSYKHATGTTVNNTFDRLSFLGKVSHKITNKATLDISMAFTNSMPKNPSPNIGENFIDTNWGRIYDVNYGRDKYKGPHGGEANNNYGDEYGSMPGTGTWWRLYENEYTQKETSVRPSVKLDIELLDWLRFNIEGNYNHYYTRYEGKERGSGYGGEGGQYEMKLHTKEQTNLNANFVVDKTVGDWNFSGFLRGEYYNNFLQQQEMKTKDGLIAYNQFFIANSKSTPEYTAKIADTKRMLSVAFQAGVSWRDQIFLDVTGRNDWSSTLVYSDKHGSYSYFYPSVNGSWLVSNTFREQLPEWISFAKFRGSWAQVGNDTTPYIINTAYSVNNSTYGSSNYYGLEIPTTLYDQNLKPERKNAWEVGLDWRFVDNRFGIDLTYYKENTKNQIMDISVPYQSGITKQLINAGNIQNKGIELAISTTPIRTKDWEWDINFTYTKNDNKIISLHENVADYILLAGDPTYGNYRIGSVAKVGSSYGTLMTDSQVKYDEKSGLPILVWTDSSRRAHYYRNEEEIVEIGSMVPDFLGSVSTNLTYKNWSLYVGLDMRFGGYVASYSSRYGTAYGLTENSLNGRSGYGGLTWTSQYDGLTYNDGVIPNGIIPAGTQITQANGSIYTVTSGGVSDAGQSYLELINQGVIEPTHASAWTYYNNAWTMSGRDYGVVSDTWVKKLNYIALRDISLTYQMPSTICQKLKARNMNLTLAGHNLGYLVNTMPDKQNPESIGGTAAAEFRSRSYQGVTSSFTFTINATF